MFFVDKCVSGKNAEKGKRSMKKYLSIISRKTKIKCLGIMLLAFLGSLLASIWPVKLGELYTGISGGEIGTLGQGLSAVLTFGLIYLTAEGLTIICRVLLDCIIAAHEAEVRESSVAKLLKMPVVYYSGCLSGEKTAQLNQGVAGSSQLIKIMCNDVLSTVLVTVCTLAQVFLNAPGLMAGIMILYLLVTAAISWVQIRSQNGIREQIVSKKNALDGQICQSIANLELIRGMHAERYEENRIAPRIGDIRQTESRHHRRMGFYDCLKQASKVFFEVVLLLASIAMLAHGKMNPGAVITVCMLFQQLIKPIDSVYVVMDSTVSSVIKAKALINVFMSPSDPVFDIQPSSAPSVSDEIRIEDVIVTNPEKDTPLAWYEDFVIPGGKTVALKGDNGCGKTSLIRCIKGYYPCSQGRITLFGRDLRTYDPGELADTVFYTPQISFFIAGTVRENLMYGLDRDVSDEELIHALKSVHLTGHDHSDTVIRPDPEEALQFVIGEKAEELSGGMKQRLSLARAFLRHPRLFIFDEITANLDSRAADYVLTSIESYAKRIHAGIVYISHDQSVLNRCDRVITLINKLRMNLRERAAA